jgi:hypothetical protein
LNAIKPDDQVYGIPLVIGAKKGLPNFNEIAMQNTFQITRKLLITRLTTNTPPSQFKYFMQYNLGVSNVVGVEAWNSYSNNYSRPVDIYVTNYMSMALTNDYGLNRTTLPGVLTLGASRSFPNPNSAVWPGYDAKSSVSPSLQAVLMTNVALLPQSIYRYGPPAPFLTTNMSAGFETNNPLAVNYFPQPHWSLAITNRLLFMIVDHNTRRVLDYVQLSGLNSMRNLSAEIQDPNNALGFAGLWSTNIVQANKPPMPQGVYDQIDVSKGNQGGGGADWTAYGANIGNGSKLQEIDKFRVFFGLAPVYFPPTDFELQAVKLRLSAQVPFAPTQRFYQHLTWQANDPLVHYLTGDLGNVNPATPGQKDNLKSVAQPIPNIGLINDRYQPWGGKPDQAPDANAFKMTLKDPLIVSSDNWDFPTNKFPNVGWLGRVHRGTPWQTVYLKSSPVAANTWQNWSGNPNANNAILTQPTNDWRLFDVFTTAINENSTRGQMSVNQSGLAAWSAILSGVIVLTNDASGNLGWTVIQPAGISPELLSIVQGINNARTNTALFPQQMFMHAGDVLATPQLTELSPFINTTSLQSRKAGGLSDEVIERIPQQIMSLLTLSHTPRFVIYSYGQTLHPAEHSIVNSGQFSGICTNYQVTAEMATRAVVRMEGSPTNAHLMIESFNILPPD